MTLYRNYATRTQAVTALNKLPLGESIMIVPYNPGAYQQESGSLKAVACKQRIKIELKRYCWWLRTKCRSPSCE